MPGTRRALRRVRSDEPGIARRRAGRGFWYVGPDGARITDPGQLERIRALAIPPAWDEVWICPSCRGHIQARGRDAAGRQQYLYHPRWRELRDQAKFDHMLDFARALPALRREVADELADGDQLGRERVLACAVRLLDVGFFRVGGEAYANEREHYGLATLLKSHVRLTKDSMVVFDFVAKSGKRRIQSVVDPQVREIVAALKRRRGGGPELLAYRSGRRWVDVRSGDINAYLKEHTSADCSAKDFRTWHATVLAAVTLASADPADSAARRRRVVSRMYREVAHYLGNTPAVARSAYVDPRVVDLYEHGETVQRALERAGSDAPEAIERAVVDLLTR